MEITAVAGDQYPVRAAQRIAQEVQHALSTRNRCSLVLTGGSTPAPIYRELAHIDALPWKRVDLFWGDERWVPRRDPRSNYRMVEENLLSGIRGELPGIYPMDTELGAAEDGAAHYQQLLRQALGLRGGEFPAFDVVLLGVGEDGHLASLFPGSVCLKETETLCCRALSPTGETRLTLTAPVLFGARRIFFFGHRFQKSGNHQKSDRGQR